jgi:fermentation-respiration switch protein FrsA (DUF1100 family)
MATVALGLLLVLALLNGLLYVQQPAMVFIPYRPLDATPRDWGLEFEDVSLTTPDGVRLHAWYIPSPGARPVLLFFHGNAGNISHRGDSVAIFHRLALNVLIVDYRGYGRSEGAPSERGLYRDAEAAWRYLTEGRGVDPAEIVVFGRSLGAAVAARLAATHPPGLLILESAFSSARDVASAVLPLLSRLVILRYRFDTERQVARVACPVLVLHSPDDEMIPFRLGERVYEAANEPRAFVRLAGDHNTGFLMSQPDYERAIDRFLTEHLPGRKARGVSGDPDPGGEAGNG